MKNQAFLMYDDSQVMRSGNYNKILLFSEGDDFFKGT